MVDRVAKNQTLLSTNTYTTDNQNIIWYLELGCIFNMNLKQLALALESSGEHELSGLEETKKKLGAPQGDC